MWVLPRPLPGEQHGQGGPVLSEVGILVQGLLRPCCRLLDRCGRGRRPGGWRGRRRRHRFRFGELILQSTRCGWREIVRESSSTLLPVRTRFTCSCR